MAEREEESGGGGVAGEGGDCGHREGEESGDDGFEGGDQVVESIYGAGGGAGGLGPCKVEAVGEEFAVGDGDECGTMDSLGFDLGESEDESFDES